MRPGTNVTTSTATPPAQLPTDTGTWFAVGIAKQGPTKPVLITSFDRYQRVYGGRGTSPTLSDAVETFFKEGGNRVYVRRVVGPLAKPAKVEIENAGKTKKLLKVEAIGAGTWANTYKIVIAVEGSTFTVTVQNGSGEVLEISPALSSNAEAATWGKESTYVTIIALETELPSAGTSELTGGTDADAEVSTTQYKEGLESFGPELGPGQLSVPGVSTTAVVEALGRIASKQARRYIGDLADGASKAELKTAAAALRTLGVEGRVGSLWGDWQDISPAPGTTIARACPPSPFVAAACAGVDAKGNPNLPVAGKQGILENSLRKHTSFTEAEYEELYAAGVNLCKTIGGQVRLYGNRTPANPNTEALYLQFSNVRLDMAIIWKALAIEENFMFTQIDGQGLDIAAYGNALTSMMLELYKVNAVFGETPQAAYAVEVVSVNTAKTEEEGSLNATIAARRSPGADQVNLNVVRVAVTQEV